MKEINLKVAGMACTGCEIRIKNVLQDIEGVKEVNASHEKKTVNIVLDAPVDENIIKKAILNLGYEVIEDN